MQVIHNGCLSMVVSRNYSSRGFLILLGSIISDQGIALQDCRKVTAISKKCRTTCNQDNQAEQHFGFCRAVNADPPGSRIFPSPFR